MYSSCAAASKSSAPLVAVSICAIISFTSTIGSSPIVLSVFWNTINSPLIRMSDPGSTSGSAVRPTYIGSMSAVCSTTPSIRPKLVIASIVAVPFGV